MDSKFAHLDVADRLYYRVAVFSHSAEELE
jgi:hypothetical protein